jgi:hypothetical protein
MVLAEPQGLNLAKTIHHPMATNARFVRSATRALVAGLPVAIAAVGLLYFLSFCFVDQGLAAFARGYPEVEGVDPNDILFWPTCPGR